MKYLLIFACFFGSLLIDPAALAQKAEAQQPKVYVKFEPDDKYSQGGTKETRLDDKLRPVEECWKDLQGRTKAKHYFVYGDKGGLDREGWEFDTAHEGRPDQVPGVQYPNVPLRKTWTTVESTRFRLTPSGNGNWTVREDRWSIKDGLVRGIEAEVSKKDFDSFLEEVEKQFAKDGTIPPNPFEKKEPKEVDTEVKQPDLSKVPQVSAKKDCEGLREKVRTLQDLLRTRQADPASPKQELETIRKQIDELLNRLADCPKQEPIDAQFDCLKLKFPDVMRSFATTLAYDVTSKREFEWDGQAWIAKDTKESICPPSGIDPCLVGTWECTSFKEANKFITGGGTGFRVTFKSDGTETVDYSKMQPIRAGDDKMVYEGKATARISAKDGVAKIETMIDAAAKFNASFLAKRYGKEWNPKLPELGPGGLGTTKGKNNYKCTGDSLEYQSSTPRGEADCTVTLRKCTQEAQKDKSKP